MSFAECLNTEFFISSVITLNVTRLDIAGLSVVRLDVVGLNVVAPLPLPLETFLIGLSKQKSIGVLVSTMFTFFGVHFPLYRVSSTIS